MFLSLKDKGILIVCIECWEHQGSFPVSLYVVVVSNDRGSSMVGRF